MDDAIPTPAEYAALSVSFSAGDRVAALAEFNAAVETEPSFKLAPAEWLAEVRACIAGEA